MKPITISPPRAAFFLLLAACCGAGTVLIPRAVSNTPDTSTTAWSAAHKACINAEKWNIINTGWNGFTPVVTEAESAAATDPAWQPFSDDIKAYMTQIQKPDNGVDDPATVADWNVLLADCQATRPPRS